MRFTTYQFGVAIGLVSISFFFGALILAFGLRIQDQPLLRPFHAPSILWASTLVLAASSAAFEYSRNNLRHALVKAYRRHILLTIALGLLFLLMQMTAGWELVRQGAPAEGNPRGSMFYVFMTLHGVHLLGGISWLGYLQFASRRLLTGTETDLRIHRRVVSAASLYWHFMGLLWVVLYFFLLRWSR